MRSLSAMQFSPVTRSCFPQSYPNGPKLDHTDDVAFWHSADIEPFSASVRLTKAAWWLHWGVIP